MNKKFVKKEGKGTKTTFFRKGLLPLFILLATLLALPTSAHAGKTDASGGHVDKDTGIYHYHHGYPAHQHTGGRCPYDFDDKTGQSSGSSSTTPKETSAATTPTPIAPARPSTTTSAAESFSDSEITPTPRPQGSGAGTSSSHHPSSPSGSSDASEAFTWLFILAIVIGLIAVIASSAQHQKEDEERRAKEREQAEQAERARQERQCALQREEERLQREAEARAEREREEKLRELHKTYDGKHVLSFVDIPRGSEMELGDLPREIGAINHWGDKYTFYVTENGTSYHTRHCQYARYGRPIHALAVGKDRRPCKLCGATLPPLEWAVEYRKIRSLSKAYKLDVDFTPPPIWYPPFVIRADQKALSKAFIANLDPARTKRAIEENFTIIETEDKKSATIVHSDNEEGYTTTLAHCTCRDNSFRHAVCKHMIALAIHKGALDVKESKL